MFYLREKWGISQKIVQIKKEKASKLIHSLDLATDEDIESWYDEQDEPDAFTVFGLEYTDSESSSETGSSSSEEHFPVLQAEEIPRFQNAEINSLGVIPPLPNVEIHILPSKYEIPIKVIAFMDTGAQKTLMNPAILPSPAWESGVHYFKAADGKIFRTDLVTKHKVGIKLFSGCVIWTKVIGTYLPNKDLVIGMDVYTQNHQLHILSQEIKFK